MQKLKIMCIFVCEMKRILYFVLFAAMIHSCGRRGDDYVLDVCDEQIDSHPDSVAFLLDRIQEENLVNDASTRMKYRLLKLRIQNSMDRPFMQIDSIKEVVEYYDSKGNGTERLNARYLLGRAYYLSGDALMATEYYQKCLQDTMVIDDAGYNVLLCKVHIQLSQIYHDQKLDSLEECEIYAAENAARRAGDSLLEMRCRNYRFGPYYLRGDHRSIIQVVRELCRRYESMGLDVEAVRLQTILLTSYLELGDYASAKNVMDVYERESGNFDSCGNVNPGKEIYYNKKGLYYLGIEKYDSAEFYFRRLMSFKDDINNTEAACSSLLKLYRRLGITDSVGKYANLYCIANDSAHKQLVSDEMIRCQQIYNYSRYRDDAEKRSMELRREKMQKWIVITFCIVAAISLILMWRRYRSVQMKKRRKLVSDYGHAMYLKKRLEMTAQEREREIARLEKDIKSLSEMLRDNKSNTSGAHSGYRNGYILEVMHIYAKDPVHAAQNVSSAEWRSLEDYVKEEDAQFARFVESKSLSKNEERATFLLRLGFESDEVRNLMGIHSNSLTNIKTRAQNKLFGSETAKDFTRKVRNWKDD